ncbi:hypothetical protein [Thermaerobacter subterraneus]|uniref:Coenzyme F420:L-glutamate ligase-like domain-containing protein n=1 Tax=Thermaerobacter subterraneus DSM 13965 TaxID=867903 RepID=K6PZ92_9FIRM|nr:hypothetical protein [Thermaerobacter subterraneus]EKP94083.1 hypothetical protein ThesuDRAFT_01808 [Thermaerobacter subterraneus DSM 13965]
MRSEPTGSTARTMDEPGRRPAAGGPGAPIAARGTATVPQSRLPGEPFTFPGHEPATLPRPDVEPDRWPREEPDTIVAPTEVVEPAVYPRPEPETPAQPVRDPGREPETAGTGGPAGAREQPAPVGYAGADPAGTGPLAAAPGEVFITRVRIGPHAFERVVIRTHWFERGEDLAATLRRYLAPHLRPGDHAIISETAVIAVRGRMVPAHQVQPGRLATLLARYVRPTGWGQGLSIPHKMQVAIEETGRLRILAAAAAAALTRPLGIRGVFYHVAGTGARSLDGMRAGSPYEGYVLPPLRRAEALAIARELAAALGAPVHIVDINDNGGTIRASSHPFPWRLLLAILRDNPLGQGDRRCPIGLIRRWEGSFGLLGDE